MKYIIKLIGPKNEKAIFAKPGYNWNPKLGFYKDENNKTELLIKTYSQAQDDAMFCSLNVSFEEHENMKKLYFLMS